jgi:succinoglycan biosynthesis transport protein ExoP
MLAPPSPNRMSNEQKYLALPSPEFTSGAPAPMERVAFYQAQAPEQEPEGSSVPIAHYLWMLSRHKWRLLLFVSIAVASTIVISSRLTPYYESVATIDVDRMAPNAVIGQEANQSRAMSMSDSDIFLSTQVSLIKSDSVLRPVVQKLKIKVGSQKPNAPRDALGEQAPVVLPYLTVTRPPKTYLLQISYRSPDRAFAAEVANAVAKSYIDHSYAIRFEASGTQAIFMNRQLEELQAKMERSSAALVQFEKELAVINPEEKTNILSARLLQLNTEWTNAQGDRVRKQAAANAVRTGSTEALEASPQGEQIRRLADRINEETEKFAGIKTQFAPRHPEYIKAASRLAQFQQDFENLKLSVGKRVESEYREALDREKGIQEAVAESKKEFDQLNGKSVQYKALKRDADADKTLYDELNKKIKEAGINAGFQGSSIRLADLARPGRSPVFPKVRTNAILAFLISTFLGVLAIFILENLDHTLKDPDQIQRQLQTEVLGALPVVKAWRGHLPGVDAEGNRRELFGSGNSVASTYEEAVRTLRDSILLPNADQRPRSLLLTSATPREGKTTTAVHLAVVHSQQKRKTLIIDCDLRRPGVYHHVGVPNDKGMSDVINGDANWRDLLQHPTALPYLTVLPAGPPSRRAADGLGEMLRRVLAEATQEYDLVICDAPPLLGFAETLQIAALVDGVVVVALAGQTERTAVASVLTNLKRLRANVIGLALNEVRADMSERYYYYGYYGKYYSRYYKPLSS